jgi:hypothetical protein
MNTFFRAFSFAGSSGINTFSSLTAMDNVNRKVGCLSILGTGDGAEDGKIISQSPHVNGQFLLTFGKLLQRHHVSFLPAHLHFF